MLVRASTPLDSPGLDSPGLSGGTLVEERTLRPLRREGEDRRERGHRHSGQGAVRKGLGTQPRPIALPYLPGVRGDHDGAARRRIREGLLTGIFARRWRTITISVVAVMSLSAFE